MSLGETRDIERPRILVPRTWHWAFDAAVTGLVFTRSGRHLGAALGDGTLRIMPRHDPEASPRTVAVHDGAALCLERDLGPNAFLSGGDDGWLVRTNIDGSRELLLTAPGQWIDTIAVGESLRAVALGREVRILAASGTETGRSADHPSTVSGLAFNPKGKRLAVSHYDGVTLWWTSALGKTPKRFKWRGSHIGVSWSPDGAFLVTATQENELHGWRVADGVDMRMSGYARKVRSLGWVAKPLYLLSAGSESVVAWPFSRGGPMGKAPLELGDRGGPLVSVVAAHPKRPLVAFAYADGEVRVAELPGDRMVSVKPAGEGKPTNLAWSSDGAALAVGTEDGAVCLIELSKHNE
jgi:WD40 repeat protein